MRLLFFGLFAAVVALNHAVIAEREATVTVQVEDFEEVTPTVPEFDHHTGESSISEPEDQHGTECDDLYHNLDDFNGTITTSLRRKWPCRLLKFWTSYLPFVNLVKGLLYQGTLIIVIIGIIFNTLSLLVLTSSEMRDVSTNNYLAVLAFYDTCVLTFNFLTGVLRGQNLDINKNFQDSEALCKFHSVCVDIFTLLSVWMIVCVTLERFLAVHFPLRVVSWCTVGKARKIIAGVSIVLVIISLHKIFLTGFEGDSVFGYKACRTSRAQLKQVVYLFVALSTWIPVLTIIGLNIGIVRKLNMQRKEQLELSANGQNSKISERQNRLTKILLALSSAYLGLVLPLGILQSIELYWNNVQVVPPSTIEPYKSDYIYFQRVKITLKWIRAFCFCFYQINFSINFFVYCLSGEKFRNALKKLLRWNIIVGDRKETTNNVAVTVQTAVSQSDANAADNKA